MIMCEECGKKLGFVEGYKHPTLGKKHLLCAHCFDQVSESVEKWSNFIFSNSFIIDLSNNDTKFNWKNVAIRFNQIQQNYPNIFDDKRNESFHNNKQQTLMKTILMNVN